jgi:transposase-like protein
METEFEGASPWRKLPAWISSPTTDRFPPIRHAISLCLRFTLSYRDVEGLLAERGLDVSYETVRRWF